MLDDRKLFCVHLPHHTLKVNQPALDSAIYCTDARTPASARHFLFASRKNVTSRNKAKILVEMERLFTRLSHGHNKGRKIG